MSTIFSGNSIDRMTQTPLGPHNGVQTPKGHEMVPKAENQLLFYVETYPT